MKNKKIFTIIAISIIIIGIIAIIFFKMMHKKEENRTKNNIENNLEESIEEEEQENKQEGTIDIVDINSKVRPYAIIINNTPVAVKVQTGLNKAYMVYELPTEGNTSRLMALYKNIEEDLMIGTIRSSRQYFIDYALESDSILIHYGWNHYAEDDEKAGNIEYINGLFDKSFWRENLANLATEHTAYTSIDKIKQTISSKGYRSTSESKTLLKYNTEDVDISKKQDAKTANKVIIPYGSNPNITTFIYDAENKMYNRMEADVLCKDYKTGEQVNTKNIIIQKVDYTMCSDNYYWDLKTIGKGDGYFITNGYVVPITWEKSSRLTKTSYYYKDGTEIKVSDGRTYIELQTIKQKLTIE